MIARKRRDRSYRAWRLGDGLPSWYEEEQARDTEPIRRVGGRWEIDTLEGIEYATDDDWCIEGTKGEYYPMSPESFNTRYESYGDGRYRSVSRAVECWPFDSSETADMPRWLLDALATGAAELDGETLLVHATWGDQVARVGDDVVFHAGEGDIYPCKRDVFDATYEVVG